MFEPTPHSGVRILSTDAPHVSPFRISAIYINICIDFVCPAHLHLSQKPYLCLLNVFISCNWNSDNDHEKIIRWKFLLLFQKFRASLLHDSLIQCRIAISWHAVVEHTKRYYYFFSSAYSCITHQSQCTRMCVCVITYACIVCFCEALALSYSSSSLIPSIIHLLILSMSLINGLTARKSRRRPNQSLCDVSTASVATSDPVACARLLIAVTPTDIWKIHEMFIYRTACPQPNDLWCKGRHISISIFFSSP